MKRIRILCLTLGLVLSLASCTTPAPPAESGTNNETSATVSSESEDAATSDSAVSDAESTDADLSESTADENSDETSTENEHGSTTNETVSVAGATENTTNTTKRNTTTSKPFLTTIVTKTTTAKPTTKVTVAPPTKTTTKATAKPAATTTTKAITGSGPAVHAYCEQVWTLVNRERAAVGLSPLTYRYDLQALADIRTEEIAVSFSHTRPNGTSCFTVFEEANIPFRSVAENIAAGQTTPEQVMKAWMNSEGHRNNILGNYTGIVVGYENNHWVQLFIRD